MTTIDNADLIYCVKCRDKTANVDAERVDDEERPRRHQGDVRSLRNQKVPHRRIKKTAASTGSVSRRQQQQSRSDMDRKEPIT